MSKGRRSAHWRRTKEEAMKLVAHICESFTRGSRRVLYVGRSGVQTTRLVQHDYPVTTPSLPAIGKTWRFSSSRWYRAFIG